jgi:glutamyl-tRNA synthetase
MLPEEVKMSKELANAAFPNIDKTIEFYENLYPKRNLPEGAIVTRFAPSPTGFVHIGSLCTANFASRMAKQSGGIYYLRIEDKDGKREVENGITGIIEGLRLLMLNLMKAQLVRMKKQAIMDHIYKVIEKKYIKLLLKA